MNIEGHIAIQLQANNNEHEKVNIHSTRPVHAAKILIGKTPKQALSVVPLLFSVCGVAQSRASLSAIQQALGESQNIKAEQARDLIVLSETAKEHCLRIFMDWPQLFELKINTQALPYLSQLIASFKATLFEQGDAFSLSSQCISQPNKTNDLISTLDDYLVQHVFHCPLQQWLDFNSIDALREWAEKDQHMGAAAFSLQHICENSWPSQGHSSCNPLPSLNIKQLLEMLSSQKAKQFIEQPSWQGQHYETNSLSRQIKHPLIQLLHTEFDYGLITRWTARLVELALIPQQMRDLYQKIQTQSAGTETSTEKLGIAQVEAARGRLIHRVELTAEKNDNVTISNYQIVAPTEWNFHPKGLIKKSLINIKVHNKKEHEQLAHLMINAIDPCVAYKLSVH